MKITDVIATAVGNSLRSRLRTILTVTAIFIGAFTLTLTSAIGTGVSAYIDDQIAAVGAKDVLSVTKTVDDSAEPSEGPAPYDPDKIQPGAGPSGGGVLTAKDVTAIGGIKGILDVNPVLQISPDYVEYKDNGKFELTVNAGAALSTPNLAAGSQVKAEGSGHQILLATSDLRSLEFPTAEAAVGKTVAIGITDYLGGLHEVRATVAGVQTETLLSAGGVLNQALTDELYRVQSTGLPAAASAGSQLATAHFSAEATGEDISALKKDLAASGYTALTVADQIGMLQTVIGAIIGILNAFGIIALIAAGFGIINTLLMSVQERTREI